MALQDYRDTRDVCGSMAHRVVTNIGVVGRIQKCSAPRGVFSYYLTLGMLKVIGGHQEFKQGSCAGS